MIIHLRREDAVLEKMPEDDPVHSGDFISRWATVYRTDDRKLEVGFEELDGDMVAQPVSPMEEILFVLAGTAEVEWEGGRHTVEAGDVLIQLQPVGKTIRADNLSLAYVVRYPEPPE